MAKHTQTIRRLFADELFECVWPFCGLALNGLKALLNGYKLADNMVEVYSLQASLLLPSSIHEEYGLKPIRTIIFMTTEMVVT